MAHSQLRLSIIIPAPVWSPDWPALKALKNNPPPGPHEIIIAIGNHPSIQRNEALKIAKYPMIVFLDSDAAIADDYWAVLEENMVEHDVKIVGGPSRLQPGYTFLESIFQGLLTHTLVVGPMAHRYKMARFKSSASQQDLILCNLVSRAEVFTQIGLFSSDLFPNEENEWMDRASAAGLRMVYQPLLQIFRPQRKTLRQFLFTMIRYGIGRTHQFRVAGVFALPMILPFVLVIACFGFVFSMVKLGAGVSLLGLVAGYFGLALVHGVTSFFICDPRPGSKEALLIGALGPLVPVTYGLGQLIGWFVAKPCRTTVSVNLVTPENQPILSNSQT